MKKQIALVCMFILISTCLLSCQKKEDTIEKVDSSENNTVIENVTDESGEKVTDQNGEDVTAVYEEIPVVDDKGKPVLDDNGEQITKKIPATSKSNGTTGNSASSDNKPSNGTIEDNTPEPTQQPIKPIDSTSKPTSPPINPPTPPIKPTDPPIQPTTPPIKPTDPPTQPIKPTDPPTQPALSYDIDYFVQYAKKYGKSIGLTLRQDGTPENGSWDTPIIVTCPISEQWKADYKITEIKGYCDGIKKDGDTSFWVYAEKKPDGRYNLYIGY